MKEKIETAIREYQCVGCMDGPGLTCFKPDKNGGVGCGEHFGGTYVSGIGKIILGLPAGFCRTGLFEKLRPVIFEKFDDCDWYDTKFNIPVWKHLNKEGHTLVRGLSPRVNSPFIHIFLEDCMSKIDCAEITADEINEMD